MGQLNLEPIVVAHSPRAIHIRYRAGKKAILGPIRFLQYLAFRCACRVLSDIGGGTPTSDTRIMIGKRGLRFGSVEPK